MNMNLCINCGIATDRCNTIGRRLLLEDDAVLSIVREWVAPQTVNEDDIICQSCWHCANSVSLDGNRPEEPPLGHRRVCTLCGRSLLRRTRCHQLKAASVEDSRVLAVVKEWILPRTVSVSSILCHSCWMRTTKASRHFHSGPSTSATSSTAINEPYPHESVDIPERQHAPVQVSQLMPNDAPYVHESSNISESQSPPRQEPQPAPWDESQLVPGQESQPAPRQELPTAPNVPRASTIVLPAYFRAVETESRCFVEGCRRHERNRITLSMRKQLLNMYNYYVPPNNRVCDFHLTCTSWDFLNDITNNIINSFTANQIQDMMLINKTESNFLNFERIESMEDHVFYHWVGFNKHQFMQILNEVPQFLSLKRGYTTLAAYLMKLRTGDSDDRLSTLLQIPKTTLSNLLAKARYLLYNYFVPHHLGLRHMNRQHIINRNQLIPNELFGYHNGEIKPIIVLDGTYVYIQKSSNYKYQKKTYSLHKYQNLVKPFLIVCTDGYIIDVLGPYPATTSDAEIINKEFVNDSELREFFQAGDAFILDRGFRDALPLLNDCGYRTYVPSSLQQGESQLTTLDANKSRAVTICRWVIEAVNGRFKRDFKLLRQDFFNKASKNIMIHFEVAAALINAFHPPVTNRSDAQEILEKINQNMYVENVLSDYVISNNLNRHRANFQPIDVQRENFQDFPELSFSELILVSLGTYQIKQARSYYGEHVRAGSYVIEVCREVDSNLLQELSTSETTWLLRGRIKSRHISSKIYFVYILVDSSLDGRESIIQYYCNCIVGKRTVGCCAHTMTIIWYLGWARYQEYIAPPAQFLDSILLCYIDGEE